MGADAIRFANSLIENDRSGATSICLPDHVLDLAWTIGVAATPQRKQVVCCRRRANA